MFLELVFFTALSPILPELQRRLGLSTSAAGALVAMYAVGGAMGAIPAVMVAVRIGVRSTVLVSLALLAAMSVLFGVANGYGLLLTARLGQGLAGAACWTAGMLWLLDATPASRRGGVLGLAFGVSEAGAIAGPVVGGGAAAVGRGTMFAAVAALCLLLAFATKRFPAPARPAHRRLRLQDTLASPAVLKAIAITLLPAMLLAAVSVLAPLQQHSLGASATEIASAFAVAALLGIAVRPFYGRWVDRRGPLRPTRLGLLACALTAVALPWMQTRLGAATLVVLTLIAIGVLWAPVMVLLSDACDATGAPQMLVVAIMGLSWPPGNVVGAAGGAALAQVVGQRVTYAVMAGMLVAGYLVLSGKHAPASGSTVADRLSLPGT
jgi:DHA2 family methylenomycin A resistance protein-like MFS transporter